MKYTQKFLFWFGMMIIYFLSDIIYSSPIVLYKYILSGITTYILIYVFDRKKKTRQSFFYDIKTIKQPTPAAEIPNNTPPRPLKAPKKASEPIFAKHLFLAFIYNCDFAYSCANTDVVDELIDHSVIKHDKIETLHIFKIFFIYFSYGAFEMPFVLKNKIYTIQHTEIEISLFMCVVDVFIIPYYTSY